MKKAQKILEEIISIGVDPSQDVNIADVEDYLEETPDSSFLRNTFRLTDNYNFFIFAKFIGDLNGVETSSLIIKEYGGVPCMGMIFFSDTIAETKLTLDYLTPLMLHHFIRLLGFNYQIIKTQYFETGTFDNVITYAQKYFGCNEIGIINLNYNTNEGTYEGKVGYYNLDGLYWPKRLLLGELMTKFYYPEEQVLSGFTLALLKDLKYLEVKKEYTGGLMRFGKHKGCEFFSDNCNFHLGDTAFTFANEFFLPENEPELPIPSCSSGRLSKTTYEITNGGEESGSGYDGSGYDGSGYDGSGYDGSGYDGSGYDGSGYDGSGYDGSGYDGSGYENGYRNLRRIEKEYQRRLFVRQVNDETCPIARFNKNIIMVVALI